MSLIVFGSMAFDHIISPYGDSGKIVGGAAYYASLAANFFEKDVKILSVIGNDFPKSECDFLTKKNIALEGIQLITDKPSFFWKGKYHTDMNHRDSLDTQINALEDFKATVPESYKNVEYILLGNLDPALQIRTLEQMHTRPKFIALDTMNFWMDIALDNLKKVIKKVDLLIINDSEARQLSGEQHLKNAAQQILAMGTPMLIIKKGEHGALLFSGDQEFAMPALLLKNVFDPTGAGDTFAGALMGYVATTKNYSFENIKKAMIIGSVVASFCIEKFGAERLKEIQYTDIQSRINELCSLMTLDKKIEINF